MHGGRGVGIVGEPELRMLGAVGEPTAWTVGGAEGKPAKFGAGVGGGDGDGGEEVTGPSTWSKTA